MINVSIVTVSSGWILQKLSERIAANNNNPEFNYKVVHEADTTADVNYYMDIQNCYFGQKTKLDVGMMTHADRHSKEWLEQMFQRQNAYRLDGIVSMNQRYTDMLPEIGYPPKKTITIVPGETYEMFPMKKVKILIVSRGSYEGYGQFFMERLFENYDLTNFQFTFLGNGWDALKPIAKEKNIDLTLLPDADYSIYPKTYQENDYLLIPSLYTAGPISFQEALATSMPVISSDVGFNNYEFKADYTYEPNNCDQLYSILMQILEPMKKRRAQVEDMRWSNYVDKLNEFILKIKK
jgi:glycosyltransferase involved in cell wall biosynthesis